MSTPQAEAVVERLRPYREVLDEACADACGEMRRNGTYSDFELREGYSELRRLSEGKDLAYDRPSIGLHYALWYHLQRTHMLIRALVPILCDREEPLTIYDIGCGTGATAWAVAAIESACADAAVRSPRLVVYGTDTSPFMVDAAEVLWDHLTKRLRLNVQATFEIGNWTDLKSRSATDSETLGVCSYLLNSSDGEYLEEIEAQLTRVADRVLLDRLLVLSSPRKARLAAAIERRGNWQTEPLQIEPDLWRGPAAAVARERRQLLDTVGEDSPLDPSWTTKTNYRLLRRFASQLRGTETTVPIVLNSEQEVAAEPEDRLTALVGAAGSGKSLVICERVVRIIERASAREPPRMLVTTFNKRMLAKLVEWTISRIEESEQSLHKKERGERSDDCTLTVGRTGVSATVWFLNRDKLPTRVWSKPVPTQGLLMRSAATRSDEARPSRRRRSVQESYLREEFLSRELELVIFGLEAMDRDRYTDPSKTSRTGRKHPLSRGQRIRLWHTLESVYESESYPFPVLLRRRIETYRFHERSLVDGTQIPLAERFAGLTHVFVDEAQDMTRADLRLLACTPPNPQRLFVAGDAAQALHTGGTSPRPQIKGAQWKVVKLSGSYRLPALVCEALKPLAKAIVEDQASSDDDSGPQGVVPEQRRSAVPGPRPLVVDATDRNEMVRAMDAASRFACGSDETEWNIIEELGAAGNTVSDLESLGIRARGCSLLKEKGLELSLVLFPTDASPPSEETAMEWVYAALTRAKTALMIAVCPDTSGPVAQALAKLEDPESLMFWHDSAREAWDKMCASAEPASGG